MVDAQHALIDPWPAPRRSVWSFPTAPQVEPEGRRVRIVHSRVTIADSRRALRVVENGHPPLYFVPLDDVRAAHLVMTRARAGSGELGEARFFDIVVERRRAPLAAWTHLAPAPRFSAIKGWVAFYADRIDRAFVGDEPVIGLPGGAGGWITSDLIGPFVARTAMARASR